MPEFTFADSDTINWETSEAVDGVEFKTLGIANGQTIEMYRFQPNVTYPDHAHGGPEFVYMLEGTARQNGVWLGPGWSAAAETGTEDIDFLSGPRGCLFVTVYTESLYFD